MFESDIVWQWAEQRNALPNEYRNARDNEPLNKSCSEKSLNGYAAVHIDMLDAASFELRENFGRLS